MEEASLAKVEEAFDIKHDDPELATSTRRSKRSSASPRRRRR
jgi:hypothetical protein